MFSALPAASVMPTECAKELVAAVDDFISERSNLLTVQSRLEAGDWDAALADLSRSGLPEPWSSSFLTTLTDRRSAGLVNLLAFQDNQPDESRDLTLMQGVDMTWLVTSQSSDHNRLLAALVAWLPLVNFLIPVILLAIKIIAARSS